MDSPDYTLFDQLNSSFKLLTFMRSPNLFEVGPSFTNYFTNSREKKRSLHWENCQFLLDFNLFDVSWLIHY